MMTEGRVFYKNADHRPNDLSTNRLLCAIADETLKFVLQYVFYRCNGYRP